jgi:hypothetical protein
VHTDKKWRRPRFSAAGVIATLALAVAVSGGTAFAASTLIKGSQIAPGTITAANIKEHTLTQADFAPGQLPTAAAAATPAYAVVIMNNVGNPTYLTQSGFPAGMTTPAPGVFCVPVPTADRGLLRPPVVTPVGAFDQVAQYSATQCPSTEYQIGERPTPTAGEGFTVFVP